MAVHSNNNPISYRIRPQRKGLAYAKPAVSEILKKLAFLYIEPSLIKLSTRSTFNEMLVQCLTLANGCKLGILQRVKAIVMLVSG
jgi:hypothetical protein